MKNSTKVLSIMILVIALAGCDQGPVGPEGPAGRDGNANVFSIGFDFSMSEAIINGAVASVQYDVPGITPNVVDEGAVLMFFREQGTWTAMPYTFSFESEDLAAVDYTVEFGYGFEDGFLEVFYEASTDEVALDDMPDRQMKAIIIDGFPAGKSDIDWTNYQQVAAYFGLTG